ncbi:MAG: transposase family protein [Clostridiaceae bacterium]|jgi:transposase|nr:transposase family protein [Clostridiaceae bacterium]
MGRKVNNYTDEYKSTIVELFNSGKTYSELNSEYGVPKTTIRRWVTKHKKKNNGTEAKEKNIKEILKRDAMLQEENK